MRRILSFVLAASLACLLVAVTPGSAAAATSCVRVKPGPDGYVRCTQVTGMRFKTVRVESVPVRNLSGVTVRASCSFSATVTRTVEAGMSLNAGAKAQIVKVVEIGSEWTAHASLSQTAARATEVAGSFTLKPGQSVTCVRTYGHVTASLKTWDRWDVGAQVRNVRTSSVKVPSRLGADFL